MPQPGKRHFAGYWAVLHDGTILGVHANDLGPTQRRKPKPLSQPTRGKTAPNRLRKTDTFLGVAYPDWVRHLPGLYVDLGYGAYPTPWRLTGSSARGMRPGSTPALMPPTRATFLSGRRCVWPTSTAIVWTAGLPCSGAGFSAWGRTGLGIDSLQQN